MRDKKFGSYYKCRDCLLKQNRFVLFISLSMNHPFPGSRSPVQGNPMQFYNPQKDSLNPNNPTLYQNGVPGTSNFMPNSNSRSFVTRSSIIDQPKPSNNTSAYLQKPNDNPPPPGKFMNTATSPTTYSGSSFPNYPSFQAKSPNNEMVKSSFHQSNKSESTIGFSPQTDKVPFTNTPTRRAPRMSEGGIFEPNPPPSSFPKGFDFKTPNNDKSNESPLIKKSNKDFENNFFKNKAAQKDQKPTSSTLSKGQSFGKSSMGKKRPITVNDFRKIKELGSGKYGQVSLVQQRYTGFTCALKKIEKKLLKEQEITEQFIRELKIQTYLNHPNIIKMYGFFDDETHIYIILEVGTGGQLYHQLRKSEPMAEVKVANIMKQVCDAVNEIHSLKIIHRDIKPENIVLHDNVVKLCDFGWSVYQDNRLRTTFCGTPLYVCPEILKGKEYDEKIDIWSLGIMMYEMLVGENPFKITKEEELIKIVKDQISIPSYVFVSREGRDFLDKCLRKNPNDRVSIKQLLNHEFFTKNAEKDKDKKVAF